MKQVRWKFVAFWVVLFSVWYTWPTEGQERVLALGVNPTKCPAPCRITVKAIAKPNKDNEKIVLVWANVLDNDSNAGSQPFFANEANLTLEVPQGYYTIQAVLYRKGKAVSEVDIFVAVGVDMPGNKAVRFGQKAPP